MDAALCSSRIGASRNPINGSVYSRGISSRQEFGSTQPSMKREQDMPQPRCRSFVAMAFALSCLFDLAPAWAQSASAPSISAPEKPQKEVLFDLEMLFAKTLGPGLDRYSFLEQMKHPFNFHDLDHDGAITDADR